MQRFTMVMLVKKRKKGERRFKNEDVLVQALSIDGDFDIFGITFRK